MRVMMKVSIPTETGNEAVKNELLPKTFGEFIEKTKPEAVYFIAENGCRTGLLFFDLKDATDIPTVCEPFFMNLNAKIEITPAMDAADMKSGVEKAMKNA
jgi:hypothetical protein